MTDVSAEPTVTEPGGQVPAVDFLVLDDGPPHLVGHRCDACGATFLERHNACASCGGRAFTRAGLPTTGCIESFTVLVRGAPRQMGPFISILVRLDDGTYVKSHLRGVPPEPESVDTDVPVRLVTYPAGTDDEGTEAIGFGFEYDRGDSDGER